MIETETLFTQIEQLPDAVQLHVVDYIQFLTLKYETPLNDELSYFLPDEHKKELDKRLEKMEKGETKFKRWEIIKQKYETCQNF